MLEQEIEVMNRSGLHTRPAALLVKLSSRFDCDVYLIRDEFEINAKSIIGVMTLAAEQGCKLTIRTDGEDEKEAMDGLLNLFSSGFGEL